MTTTVFSDDFNTFIRLGEANETVEATDRADLFQVLENGGDDVILGFDPENDFIDLRSISFDDGELVSEVTEDGFLLSWDGGSLLLEGINEDISASAIIGSDERDTDIIFATEGNDTIVGSSDSDTVVIGFDDDDTLSFAFNPDSQELGEEDVLPNVDETGLNVTFGEANTFLPNFFDATVLDDVQVFEFNIQIFELNGLF